MRFEIPFGDYIVQGTFSGGPYEDGSDDWDYALRKGGTVIHRDTVSVPHGSTEKVVHAKAIEHARSLGKLA